MVGCWRGYLSGARCRLAYGPADATATHFSYFSKIQIDVTFVYSGSPFVNVQLNVDCLQDYVILKM